MRSNLSCKFCLNLLFLSNLQIEESNLGTYASLILLCLAGAVQPSIPNGIYFLFFLVFSTWLACNQKLERRFSVLLRLISVIICCHIVAIILFQTSLMQTSLYKSSFTQRVSGLSRIFTQTENPENYLELDKTLGFDVYLNPFVLFMTHFILILTSDAILVR